ncbi:hypothetical protein AB8B02_08650 [Tardiphaga sp. 862_B3_N4_1]|uniref:hypothetical protein n=1 Tax=Tardiphaga sp. 862_B3_N4_1 TaxID=3240764 RepID=UPI003F221F24
MLQTAKSCYREDQRDCTSYAEHATIATLLIALAATWFAITQIWPVPFWQSHDDYAYLALAHALNFESSLRDGVVYPNPGLQTHPGIPFYVISWLCMRAAALFTGHSDAIELSLSNPEPFFLATRIVAGLLTSGGIAAAFFVLRPLALPLRVVAVLAFFADPTSFRYGLTILSNESFALPLMVILFWALKRIADQNHFSARSWAVLGAVCALAYSVKLLYLNVLVASLAAVTFDAFDRTGKTTLLSALTSRLIYLTVGAVGVLIVLFLPLLGLSGLFNLIKLHLTIMFHVKTYGNGEVGILSANQVSEAATAITATSALLYLSTVLLACGAVLAWIERKDSLTKTSMLVAFAFVTISVLKHYHSHYVPAICSVLPFVVAPILGSRWLRWPATIAVCASIIYAATMAQREFAGDQALAHEIKLDEDSIASLPLASGEARLWTYRIPSIYFAKGFVIEYSAVPRLKKELGQSGEVSPTSPFKGEYRYIVLDRAYFPTEESVKSAKGSLEPTQSIDVRHRACDGITVLRRTIVVTKACGG